MSLENYKKIPGQWKFMIAVLVAYTFVLIFNFDFGKKALNDTWIMFVKIIPIVGIVFFVMFLLNLFIKKEFIKKHLGSESGLKGLIYTLLASITISGPPYVLMPMLSELKKQGMKTSLIATFLSNRNIQPVFLPVMAYYFGWQYTGIVSLLVIFFSAINGFLVERVILISIKK